MTNFRTVVTLAFVSLVFFLGADSAEAQRRGRGKCPRDMLNTDNGYCIDRQRSQELVPWGEAVYICAQEGKRLCSHSEWIGACVMDVAPDMIGDPSNPGEWVDGLTSLASLTDSTAAMLPVTPSTITFPSSHLLLEPLSSCEG